MAKNIRRLEAAKDAAVQELQILQQHYDNFEVIDLQTHEHLLIIKGELDNIKTAFDNAHTRLLELDHDIDRDEHWQTKSHFISFAANLNAKLKAFTNKPPEAIQAQPSFVNPAPNVQLNVRLPEIPIPKFQGNFNEWLQFRDTFTNIIIENGSITDATKFYYLRQALEGEALACISNIPPGNNNFHIAWNLLTDRYDNTRRIASTHISALDNPPQIVKKSPQDLRSFIDHCKGHITALESLALDLDVKEMLYVHRILLHLDSSTLFDWERYTSADTLPTLANLFDFLESRCKMWERLASNVTTYQTQQDKSKSHPISKPTNKAVQNQSNNNRPPQYNSSFSQPPPCAFCKQPHPVFKCSSFLSLSPAERLTAVKQHTLCFNCLRCHSLNHICSTRKCFHCGKHHHTLLHQSFNQRESNFTNTNAPRVNTLNASADIACTNSRNSDSLHVFQPTNSMNQHSQSFSSPSCDLKSNSSIQHDYTVNANTSITPEQESYTTCVLPTAQVLVIGASGNIVRCTALLDSGADCNLITEKLANQLQLPLLNVSTKIQGVCEGNTMSSRAHIVAINSRDATWNTSQKCFVVPHITANIPGTTLNLDSLSLPEHIDLADPNFHISKCVDILLGASCYASLLTEGQILPNINTPCLQKTKLGWVIFGPCMQSGTPATQEVVNSHFVSSIRVSDQLEKFWRLEELPKSLPHSPADQYVEQHYQKNTFRIPDGRYVVSLPFKQNVSSLGHSRTQALKRFHSLESRLSQNSELRQQYHDFMKEYIDLDHMSLAPPVNSEELVFYIPHHPVLKPESTTTKLRVVFDTSAKTSSHLSLNDTLHVGPSIQPELFDITLRFRCNEIAMIADITKMYRQVCINPNDYDFQRIFWRESKNHPIREFHLKTVTYGTAPAAFLATRTLCQLADDEAAHLPQVSHALKNDFYVDDLITGCNSTIQAIQLAAQLQSTCQKGGFELRKWLSNSQEVMNSIPSHLLETALSKPISDADDNIAKALGLIWNASADTLTISSNSSDMLHKTSFSKREFLSSIASIFDPLGLISPIVISAKMLFQKLWILKLGWDDKLPDDLLTDWLKIFHNLPLISKISIPRFALCTGNIKIELHGFCDASIHAYGACVYLRSVNSDNQVSVNLLCSKSRVAPLKPMSIPRLELCAAVLLSRLVVKVLHALTITISNVSLWTDSTNVCSWIKSPPERKDIFVALRVTEIQESTSNFNWHHVRTSVNPADLISRGVSPSDLAQNTLWWHGPSWLSTMELSSEVPSVNCISIFSAKNVSSSQSMILYSVLSRLFDSCSTYSKMIRSVAFVCRFIHNTRVKHDKHVGTLTTVELSKAELLLIKLVQATSFADELKTLKSNNELSGRQSLASLVPFIDNDGLLRVGGHLQQSELPFDAKHQILLPAKHKFTRALINSIHLRLLHASTHLVMSDLRQKFWIPSTRRIIRDTLHKCIPCLRFKPTHMQQQMGQLPHSRITINHPFINCGVDYAGPISLRLGNPRSRTFVKAYLAIFVCMATRAVHCEIVTELSTKAFIAALSRFVARRGLPKSIFSDNGTNFQGASRDLADVYDFLAQSKTQKTIQTFTSSIHINWSFIPPRSPNFGGLWEAAVKSFKAIFRVVTFNQILNLEEFMTLATQIEAILNSRPIMPLTEDPHDLNFLSPGHFLIGRALTTLPPDMSTEQPSNQLKHWQRIRTMTSQLWSRWAKEYLISLQRRSKWVSSTDNIKIDTLVLIMEDNTSPANWKLGRITQLFPGPDGKVRVVSLHTATGLLKRAVSKLVPLPIDDQ